MALLKDGTRVYGNATVDTTLTTGNITLTSGIDTSYIIHEPDSSGDGNGYGTLRLIPDGNLIGSCQYVIVDPTAPGHIHLRAGGAQDASLATLIIGGENSNFIVDAGINPPVYVQSSNNVWKFDAMGNLHIPPNASVTTPDAAIAAGGYSIDIVAGASDTTVWNGNPGGNVNIVGGYGSFGDGGGGPGGFVNITAGSSSDSHAGNVVIKAGTHAWQLGYDAELTFPDGTRQSTALRINRSNFDVAAPIAVLDNIQIGINLGWQPYLTCVNVGSANAGVSTFYLSVASAQPTTELGTVVLTNGLYSYFAGGALSFANANESLQGMVTDFDSGKTYSATWYATSAGQGYVSLQQV